MSKLVKAIESFQMGDKRIVPARNVSFKHETANMPSTTMMAQTRYRFEATLGAMVWIDEDSKGAIDHKEWALADVRKHIAEQVFGEFRGVLNDMRLANHEADVHKMRELISELEYRMFVEGI